MTNDLDVNTYYYDIDTIYETEDVNRIHEPEKLKRFHTTWDDEDLDLVAESAAEFHYYEHDTENWPKIIIVYDKNENKLGTFKVSLDLEPVFSTIEINLESQDEKN